MKCRIGFKISFDLLQNSKGTQKENKRKKEGKAKKRTHRNTKFKLK